MIRSFVIASLAALCCANNVVAEDGFVVTPSDQDLFGKVGDDYKVRVRVNGQAAGVTDILKIKVWKITSAPPDATQPTGTLALADAMGDVAVTDKNGKVITELPVRNGQEDFRIKPLTSANKPLGHMVLAINPATLKAEKDVKTVSTLIGVGRQ